MIPSLLGLLNKIKFSYIMIVLIRDRYMCLFVISGSVLKQQAEFINQSDRSIISICFCDGMFRNLIFFVCF